MFYSQTFLARKGPLSTVWIAAHLQHRLKKSHYTSTDILSTVDRIMDPEVPIALRMSGHLLLGVVRIYSKKVDYLYHDCNAAVSALCKAFGSMPLNVPEDPRKAPVQSITFTGTLNFDELNLDYEIHHNGVEDTHVRNEDEITLADRTHDGMDHYLTITTFDEEDIVMNSSHTDVLPYSGARSMEDEYIIQDGGPSIQRESPVTQHVGGDHSHNFQDNSPPLVTQVMPIEVLRHHNNACNTENSPLIPDFGDNNTEPNKELDQTMSGKDHIPEIVDDLDFNGMSAPSQAQHHFGSPTPLTSQGAASEPQLCVGPNSLNLVLRASPPIQQPQRRGRKRKPFFDEPIVLSNSFIRKTLSDTRDILRKRKEVPSSTLDTFKLNNSRRKEHIFDQPLLTGLCKDLLDISRREYICSRPNLVINEEDNMDAGIAGIPPSTNQIPKETRAATPPPVNASDLEIEHLRNSILAPHPTIPACNVDMEFNIEDDRRSPVRNDELTPVSAKILRSVSLSSLGTNIASEIMQTSDLPASTGIRGLEMETPMTNLDDTFQNFGLSDTHQLINSAETEELGFLEMENNTSASSQGTSKSINELSVRTRAAAQYLKRHSPITPILEDPVGDLSLNKILEGKTRKHSARMFFEVLALKTHGLVDVQQEEPYGDVSLKLTPTLSNAQF
ncbi:sister chromatid cohesion 1 protein 3 [Gastrolobium bilobum]|uniref:sister chromatid cohesion 1 protein 3 n=1 Tax=Gastrolobium bilobum TaxID=150636 RepID=UPI002AB13967|nr:sister chromatid cohesion 1 protein 3 [Gastrolobium bilobum]